MTIGELKELLQEKIDNLTARYTDDQEVDVVSNTYFIRYRGGILETDEGFVSLDNPIEEDDQDDDDEDSFNDDEEEEEDEGNED